MACAVQAGYFAAGPAFFGGHYGHHGYGHHVVAPVLAAPVVAKVAPVYTPVVAKVPTAVSYSYFHAAHPVPILKVAAPVFAKVPYYGHVYH